jgi:hypothetical protein
MYVVTTLNKHRSNVKEDSITLSHPVQIKLEDGTIVDCSFDERKKAISSGLSVNGYFFLGHNCKFRLIQSSVQNKKSNSETSDSIIRWRLPSYAELIYPK